MIRQKISVILFVALVCASNIVKAQLKTMGLTKKLSGNDENGYVLFAPIGVDTTYLIDKCGKKVHFWKTMYTPGNSVYLKPNGNLLKCGTYEDTIFGEAGGRGGMVEEYNWNGDLLWKYKLFNDSLCQHHDIVPMPNGNVLVLAWHSISRTKAMSLGRKSDNFNQSVNELWGERILELKPVGFDSAEVVWQWDIFDHIVQDESPSLPNYGQISQHPELLNINYAYQLKTFDWIHANSLDYNEELDQIVISAHNICEFWVIDHSTTTAEAKGHSGGDAGRGGDFLYRWGNPKAYDAGLTTDQKLFRQHNARWIRNGYRDSGSIMVFNNGWGRDTFYSTVEIIKTPIKADKTYLQNTPYLPAAASWIYKDSVPSKFYAPFISGAQMLPNGNVLICSGPTGVFFEVTENKKTVWRYVNPVGPSVTQTDGQIPAGNSVFRAEFYPKDYPAFTGKTLTQKGTLEKKSLPYSCDYETIKPYVTSVSPELNSMDVLPVSELSVEFSEAVLKNKGVIRLYSNSNQIDNIDITSNKVIIADNIMKISPNVALPINSRISVRFPFDLVRDSSFNYLTKNMDTSEWHFNTIRSIPSVSVYKPAHQSVDIRKNRILELAYTENIKKANSGSFRIYENGILSSTIPVQSDSVSITGSLLTLRPIHPFTPGALIIIENDSCIESLLGVKAKPIEYSNWYFRISYLPMVQSLSPDHGAKNVSRKPDLEINLTKDVDIDSNKFIQIYENNVLKYNLSINHPSVSLSEKTLKIVPGSDFNTGSRVSVSIPGNCLVDSTGNYFAGIDSSFWSFTIQKGSSVQALKADQLFSVFPSPNNGVFTTSGKTEINKVSMFDLSGKIIEAELERVDDRSLKVKSAGINSGMYILRIESGIDIYYLRVSIL